MGTLWVRAEPASAAEVRRQIARDLVDRDLPRELVEDVLLVVTELLANAVRHARTLPSGRFGVHWQPEPDGVLVTVSDGGGAQRPTLRSAGPDETGGRGLAIVNSVSDGWGVDVTAGVVTVWAHLPVRAVDPALTLQPVG